MALCSQRGLTESLNPIKAAPPQASGQFRHAASALIGLLLIARLFAATSTAYAQTTVFINEIHYDNTGTDAGEAIEVAGPAGTDLTGWSIVLYNGSNGQTYNTAPLSGTIPDLCSGFGVIVENYPTNGIQNGSPDGIALVDNSSAVIQFLSYEGTLTATNGPANGMTSVDIGVSETGSEALGQSLQLSGTGTTYEDFSWNAPAASTFGACNTGQTFVGVETAPTVTSTAPMDGAAGVAVSDNLVITFSEPVDVSGSWFSIVGASSGSHTAVVSGGPQVFTLDPAVDFDNGEDVDVTIFASNVADVDTDDPPDNMADDFVFSFSTASTAVVGLIINEIDYDQPSTDTAEFIELLNAGSTTINLDPFVVELVNGSGGGASVYDTIDLPNVDLAPGEFFVICGDAQNVGNCDLDVTPDANLIQNGAPDAAAIKLGSTIIDAVSYEGDTGAPYTEGSGVGLEDPGTTGMDNLGISRVPNGTDTNQNNVDLALRCITPGLPNSDVATSCPASVVSLVINEIDYDQPGTDNAEFIELKNTGTFSINLVPFAIQLINGTGGGASVYLTIDLPDVILAPGDYFVVCGDASTVANCDLDVSPDANLIQNGAPDAVALVSESFVIDAVSYEGDTGAPYTEGSGAGLEDPGNSGDDNLGISRVPDGEDTNQNNLDFSVRCITPGLSNSSLSLSCGATGPALEIFEIQGAGLSSPFENQAVETKDNVVTALADNGFFIQTPDARADVDDETSNGIFVFTSTPPTVSVGDLVDVSGEVIEFFDFTEFSNGPTVTVTSSGNPLPAPVLFDNATPSPNQPQSATELERFEGMLIQIDNGVVSGPNQSFGSDPIAEMFITTSGTRAFREEGIAFPGLPGLPVWDGNPEVFELDPDRLGLPNAQIGAGSTFNGNGVLGFEFGDYEFWPTSLTVNPVSLPRAVRPRTTGESTIATLNLFRLFDDVDDPPSQNALGQTRDDEVVSTAEYDRRRAKFVKYILEVLRAPDILAVQEAEKLKVLQALAADINLLDGTVTYAAYLVEGNDVGTIDIGFLAREGVRVNGVTQLGAAELLSVDGSLLHDRPPLLLDATLADGCNVAVLCLHQRSLNGIDDPADGPRVRQKRLEQAQSVAQKVQDLQTANPNIRLIVAGDFNAFEFTDGYVDVAGQIAGDFDPGENLLSGPDLVDPDLTKLILSNLPAEERYSFNFDGSAQVLDHLLISQALNSEVSGLEYGRGNADAAIDLIDDASTPLRSSDHDGLVLYLTPNPVVVNAGDGTKIILGASITLGGDPTASGGTPPYTYDWSPTIGLSDPSSPNPVATPVATTTYKVTVTDSKGCVAAAEVKLEVGFTVFLADNRIKIDGNGPLTSEGDIHSNGNISFFKGEGSPAVHQGNLTAVKNIKILKDNLIDGDVTAGDELFLFGNAAISGEAKEGEYVPEMPLPVRSFSAGGEAVTVPKHEAVSLPPGSYGAVRVNKGGTLELAQGEYFFKSLILKRKATLKPDVTTGIITVNVQKRVIIHKEVQIDVVDEGKSSYFTLYSNQKGKLQIGKGSRIVGTLLLPKAEVHFDRKCRFRGAICADDISLEESVPFLHHFSSAVLPKVVAIDDPWTVEDEADIDEDEQEDVAVAAAVAVPTEYALEQNFPNPFNPSTKIAFALPEASEVTLMIYDLKGNVVKQVARGKCARGKYEAVWDGRNRLGEIVAGGVYLYRLTVQPENGGEAIVMTKKLTFLK